MVSWAKPLAEPLTQDLATPSIIVCPGGSPGGASVAVEERRQDNRGQRYADQPHEKDLQLLSCHAKSAKVFAGIDGLRKFMGLLDLGRIGGIPKRLHDAFSPHRSVLHVLHDDGVRMAATWANLHACHGLAYVIQRA